MQVHLKLGKLSTGCLFARSGNHVNSVTDTASDILDLVFFNVEAPLLALGEQIRSEPGFYYKESNITANFPDQRGLCSGLNLLANYDYLPS
ncbi:unnamed protein product [Adineta steineri]|uniref:Uncharacterized protein n=1 Tax=Adineta steineri TaxID=433720 RepID=A0A813N4M5_9BILA|nr:unnamed protein product [Adineta steineri]CAF0736966.1 unnamed protein product [Adineta steineri]CAF0746685.1 unnamed protein product [Adineta steineri]